MRRWWQREMLGGLVTLALALQSPLSGRAQEISGQGEGFNPGTSTVSFVQRNVTLTYSEGRLSYARTPLAEIVSNQTTETLRLTITPTSTTGSWTGVTAAAVLYAPVASAASGGLMVTAEGTNGASESQSSGPLLNYTGGSGSLNWTASGQGLAQLELSIRRSTGSLAAGTYQVTVTLAAVAS